MRELCPQKTFDKLVRLYPPIKVNLPATLQDHASGNGEGIWAVPATKHDADLARGDDNVGETITVYADNGSAYYPDVTYRSKILCTTQGPNRPTALWDDLHDTKNAPARKKALMDDLTEHRKTT